MNKIKILLVELVYAAIFIVLGVFICSERLKPYNYVDSSLIDYIETFKDEMSKRGVIADISNISVIIEKIPQNSFNEYTAAMCEFPQRIIKLDSRIFNKYGKDGYSSIIEHIIFHELGHCVFGLEHSKNENSLMYYMTKTDPNYWLNRSNLLDNFVKTIK